MPISNGNPEGELPEGAPGRFIFKDHPALKGVDLGRFGPMVPFKVIHRVLCQDSVVLIWITVRGLWGRYLCSYN